MSRFPKVFMWTVMLLFTPISPLIAQSQVGEIETYLSNIINNLPDADANDYLEPTQQDLSIFESIAQYLLQSDLTLARENAALVNYQVTEYTSSKPYEGAIYWILEEKVPKTKFWGTYVFHRDACRMICKVIYALPADSLPA